MSHQNLKVFGVASPATTAIAILALFASGAALSAQQQPLLTGQAAFTDWNQQAPGVRHKITVADLPAPHPEESVDNAPTVIPRPADAWPIAPAGFKVMLYAGGDNAPLQRSQAGEHMARAAGTFTQPRLIRTAPNGDLFVADSGAGVIDVLRGVGPDGKAAVIEQFATGLDHPFGIAFFPAESPRYVYIGNATTVVRFPYHAGDLHASGPAETVVPDIPGYAQLRGGGHWTRDVVFTEDGKHMLVSVGSGSNVDDADTHPREFHRADILEYTPDGKFTGVYGSGIRNPAGIGVNPTTGEVWCSTNERDSLGDNLVPDYITHVQQGGFYGWPWYYIGGHPDPRLEGKHPELKDKVIVPDVLLQPHNASLELTFYDGAQFPSEYRGDLFAAEHGSWNRANRTGYEVVRVPLDNGQASGVFEDFVTGFVTPGGEAWGRPVGVTVALDGALYFTDDGTKSIWRVSYVGK